MILNDEPTAVGSTARATRKGEVEINEDGGVLWTLMIFTRTQHFTHVRCNAQVDRTTRRIRYCDRSSCMLESVRTRTGSGGVGNGLAVRHPAQRDSLLASAS